MKNFLYLPILLILLSSCHTHYYRMSPEEVHFGERNNYQELKIGYKSNYLSSIDDVAYAEHAAHANIEVYAVEITNNGIEPVILGQTHHLSVGGRAGTLLETEVFHKELKFKLGRNLPALAITPLLGLTAASDEDAIDTPSPYAFWIPSAIISIGILNFAEKNGRLKKDLKKWNLFGRPIAPGETVYGVVGVKINGRTSSETLNIFHLGRF